MICSPFLPLSPECERKHLLSPRLLVSIPIHVVILPLQSTLSSGSSSLQNKLAIQAPTCSSKYSPSLHLDLQSAFLKASPSFSWCPYSYHLGHSYSSLPFPPWTVFHSHLEDAVLPSSTLNLCKYPISLCPWALLLPLHAVWSHPSSKLPLRMPCYLFSAQEQEETGVSWRLLCRFSYLLNQSRAELFTFPSPPVHSCFSSHNGHWHQVLNKACYLPWICHWIPRSATLMHTSVWDSLSHTTQTLPGIFSITDTVFPS